MEKTAGCNYFPRVERRKMIWVIVSQCPEMVPLSFRLGVIIFGSVRFLSKKSNQTEIFFYKKTETGSNRPVSVRFGLFRTKTGSNRLGSVFLGLSSVRFGFLGFKLIKPKPNRTGRFFQNSNRFNRFFS
jgi:hypothetical protein